MSTHIKKLKNLLAKLMTENIAGECVLFNSLKYRVAKIVEKHPFSWYVAWSLTERISCLLPHDKSYYALKHFCQPSDDALFLDIGANTGISALSFRKINKAIPIFSLEPNPIHRSNLERLSKKLAPMDYLLKGAGDKEMEIIFYTPVYKNIVLHTFTSSSEDQVREAVCKSFGTKVADKLEIRKIIAQVVLLDNLRLKPSIIKIDAEGFDYQVLLGGKVTIESCRPYIMIEVCHSNIEPFKTYFDDLKFKLFNYDFKKDLFTPFKIEALEYESGARNIFAIPQEKMSNIPVL
jgi:FkbM family methyltransferase